MMFWGSMPDPKWTEERNRRLTAYEAQGMDLAKAFSQVDLEMFFWGEARRQEAALGDIRENGT